MRTNSPAPTRAIANHPTQTGEHIDEQNSTGRWLGAAVLVVLASQVAILTMWGSGQAHSSMVLGSVLLLPAFAYAATRLIWKIAVLPLEKAAKQEATKARALLEAAPEAVLGVQPDGHIGFANSQASKLFGYEKHELIGLEIEMLVPEAARHRHREHRKRYAEHPHTRPMGIHMELVARRRDGDELPVEVSLSTVRSRGRDFVICIVRDVSEQRKAKNEVLLANQKLESSIGALSALNQKIRTLGEFGKLLFSCRDRQEIRSMIEKFCKQFFPGSSGTVLLTNASKNALQLEVAWGEDCRSAKTHVLIEDCWALRRGAMHDNSQINCGACQIQNAEPEHRLIQCIPMIGQGEIRGVMHLIRPKPATSDALSIDQELTTAVTDRIGLALANLQLRMALREQAIRDPLTGLYNRRFLEEFMERELSRNERSAVPLSVLALDLDHFKKLNDSFGHPAGDHVLAKFGQTLQANIRTGDVPCRFGGEEFILLLPETAMDVASARAESIRQAVEKLSVIHAGQLLSAITVSIGVAAAPGNGTSVDSLLRAADQALYRAKQLGRNRVVRASEESPGPGRAEPQEDPVGITALEMC